MGTVPSPTSRRRTPNCFPDVSHGNLPPQLNQPHQLRDYCTKGAPAGKVQISTEDASEQSPMRSSCSSPRPCGAETRSTAEARRHGGIEEALRDHQSHFKKNQLFSVLEFSVHRVKHLFTASCLLPPFLLLEARGSEAKLRIENVKLRF